MLHSSAVIEIGRVREIHCHDSSTLIGFICETWSNSLLKPANKAEVLHRQLCEKTRSLEVSTNRRSINLNYVQLTIQKLVQSIPNLRLYHLKLKFPQQVADTHLVSIRTRYTTWRLKYRLSSGF